MVNLVKASDSSPYGGHSSATSYEKTANGAVPEYVLAWRRYKNGGRVSQEAIYCLRYNDQEWLAHYYGRRI